jgi:hypothetical protein
VPPAATSRSLPSPAPRAAGLGPRWLALLAIWLVGATLVLLHSAADRDYIAVLNGLGLRDAPDATTPLRQVIPARYADAQMWVRHALTQRETGAARLRFTSVDNAPQGREVHWSSGFLWLYRGATAVHQALTGQSGPRAVERTLLWFNTPLLLALMILFSAWAGARGGTAMGVLVAAAIIGHNRFYEGFATANVDHHGLVNAALLGLLLGVSFMGAGWWQTPAHGAAPWLPDSRRAARRAAIVAGVSGGLGLGLSAAAVIPVIALVGLAALALAWWAGPAARRSGAEFEPSLWRLWGSVGAGTALVLYVLDYAPFHLGLRLEVNHPLYALAWWGGGNLVAALAAARVGRNESPGPSPRLRLLPLIPPLLALAAGPLTILLAGRTAFLVTDPFVGELRHFVAEGRSMPAFIRQLGIRPLLFDLSLGLLLVPAVFAAARRRGTVAVAIGWPALTVAALMAMSFLEVRWGRSASAAQIVLLLVLAAVAARHLSVRRRQWATAGAALLLLTPAVQRLVVARAENRQHRVAAGDLQPPLYRDIAATLRASQREGAIRLLASPNASAGISYFGGFSSLGTLFWENAAGLRAAAEIFSAATDEEAFRLIRDRKITHIAMLPTANFLGEYHRLLHPTAKADEARQAFGFRLASQRSPPPWLQPIPYRPPSDLHEAADRVRLFKVRPDQDEVDWLFYTAVAHVAAGDAALGERTLESAIARLPGPQRAGILAAGGAAFFDYGADAIAARLLQRSLQLNYEPQVALTAAWLLATSREDAVRDGIAALMLAEPLAQAAPGDPTAWSALAAAQAELGRFPPAIAAAERALAAARPAGDPVTLELLQRRLETYRAGRPWRQ